MTDLPERLRRLYVPDGTNYVQEAADEIERLRAEVDALRAERDAMAKALAELVACKALKDAGLRSPEEEDEYFRRKPAAWAAARAALAQIKQEKNSGSR